VHENDWVAGGRASFDVPDIEYTGMYLLDRAERRRSRQNRRPAYRSYRGGVRARATGDAELGGAYGDGRSTCSTKKAAAIAADFSRHVLAVAS
jgi:hypothetical protein